MNTNKITIRKTDYRNQDFPILCSELDMFLNQAIGGEDKRGKYKKYNYPETMDVVVIAYD